MGETKPCTFFAEEAEAGSGGRLRGSVGVDGGAAVAGKGCS